MGGADGCRPSGNEIPKVRGSGLDPGVEAVDLDFPGGFFQGPSHPGEPGKWESPGDQVLVP
jgi:hypothetical protein